MNLKLILAGALIAAASPALAADLGPAPVEPVAPIYIYNWNGFYVGADIGYAWTSADVDIPGASTSPDSSGVVGGIYVGYNAQFNQFVVGLEADAEASSNSDSATVEGGLLLGSVTGKADEKWRGSVRARLGYAFDNFLPYITGGVAWSDWDTTATSEFLGTVKNSDTFVGWTIGAGLEYGFTPNLIGRVEYRYTDFGSNDTDTVLGTLKTDLKDNAVRIGLAYKF